MQTISEHERASVQRRIAAIRDEIYQLALVEISEGIRADRLRSLLAELRTLETAAKTNVTPAANVSATGGTPISV